MRFELSEKQQEQVDGWLFQEVYPRVIELQKAEYINPSPFIIEMWEEGYPYEGAIGGDLTYEFSPTSIGVVTKVRYNDEELDVTEYDLW